MITVLLHRERLTFGISLCLLSSSPANPIRVGVLLSYYSLTLNAILRVAMLISRAKDPPVGYFAALSRC